MDSAAELGRNPVSKHQIQPEYGDEQADAGRDCRTRVARPNAQARTRTGKYQFSLFSWPRARLATLPGWTISLMYAWPYVHRYIHGDEQADAGLNCRTRLARPNSQARMGTGKNKFSLFRWPRVGLVILPGRSWPLSRRSILQKGNGFSQGKFRS